MNLEWDLANSEGAFYQLTEDENSLTWLRDRFERRPRPLRVL
jgi:hypothetical protein